MKAVQESCSSVAANYESFATLLTHSSTLPFRNSSKYSPFLEYAAPVWLDLQDYLTSVIESIQKKALKIILPMYDYADAMNVTGLQCLSLRRQS